MEHVTLVVTAKSNTLQ